MVVNTKFLDNWMSIFNTILAWLTRNPSLFHKICNGNGPIIIFPYYVYVNYGKSSHGHYKTGTSRKIILLHLSARNIQVPEHLTPVSLVSGVELKHIWKMRFHSVILPWRSFWKTSKDKLLENAANEHFNINYIYCMENQEYINIICSTSIIHSYSSVRSLF